MSRNVRPLARVNFVTFFSKSRSDWAHSKPGRKRSRKERTFMSSEYQTVPKEVRNIFMIICVCAYHDRFAGPSVPQDQSSSRTARIKYERADRPRCAAGGQRRRACGLHSQTRE